MSRAVALVLALSGCPSGGGGRADGAITDRPAPAEAGKPPGCGNGKLEPDESCDGVELDGRSCTSLGYVGGKLACGPLCRFDESGCSRCGDGALQGGEVCDGAELGGQTCGSLGFSGGALGCTATCQHDTSQCSGPRPGQATAVFATSGAIVARTLDTSTGVWSAASDLALVGSVRWIVSRVSPLDPTRAIAVAGVESGSSVSLYTFRRGTAWSTVSTLATTVPTATARTFDVVYQDKSGVPLMVYSDNTANPVYVTLDSAGAWSPKTKVFATPPGAAAVRWVVLASRPGTDEVALVYADAASHLFAVIWTGASFAGSTTTKLDNGMGYGGQSFDAAYEDRSGDLLVTNSNSCCRCFGYAWRRPGQGSRPGDDPFTFEGGGPCGGWAFQRLAPQRGSDAIALVGSETTAVVWGGGAFYSAVDWLWPGPGYSSGTVWADVAWVGRLPHAVAVHRGWTDSSMPEGRGRLHWLRSQPGGAWVNGAPAVVKGLGELTRVQLQAYPAEDRVIGVFSDDQSQLFVATYDEAKGWVVSNGGAPLSTDLADSGSWRPFSVHVGQQ